MKSVMNVIVTTYTIAICWVRERDKNGGREITGTAQAGKVEQIVEFIFESGKKKRESNGLGWSAASHMVELTRTEVTMIPAWLECPTSALTTLSLFPKQWDRLRLEPGCFLPL